MTAQVRRILHNMTVSTVDADTGEMLASSNRRVIASVMDISNASCWLAGQVSKQSKLREVTEEKTDGRT